jgi:hypothetical protein
VVEELYRGSAPSEDGAHVRNVSPPIVFSEDGQMITRIFIQLATPDTSADTSGNRLFMTFDDLTLGDEAGTYRITRTESQSAPCAEPPRPALTPEQAADPRNQMRVLPYEEGYRAMLNDVLPPAPK